MEWINNMNGSKTILGLDTYCLFKSFAQMPVTCFTYIFTHLEYSTELLFLLEAAANYLVI